MEEVIYDDASYRIIFKTPEVNGSNLIIARFMGLDAFKTPIWERAGVITPAVNLITELHLLRKHIGEEAYLAFLTASNLEDRR